MPSPGLTGGFGQPFQEQIDFFRKKLNLPTERWDDIRHAAHDRAFVVAGAMKADLLNDLRLAVDKAISTGTTLETFRQDFRGIVAKNGWHGWTGEGTSAGFAWRTKVIYETNLRSSYAAGRWAQLNDPSLLKLMPYWRYVHADSVLHPRPQHQRWGNMRLTLPHDHPFWKTHFPPNGWGCRCRVVAAAGPKEGDATDPPEGWDEISDKTGAPVGIDKGWAYAPGASLQHELRALVDQKKAALPLPLAEDLAKETAKVIGRKAFVEAKTAKAAAEWAVKAGLADFADYTGIKTEVANAWNKSLFDHLAEFPALRDNQKFVGTCQAQFARWRSLEIDQYIERLRAANPHLPPDFDFRPHAEKYIKPKKVPGNAYAHSVPGGPVQGIAVNRKYGSDTEQFKSLLESDALSSWHPQGCSTIRSVVDHELGHQLDNLLGLHIDADIISVYKEAVAKGIKEEVSGYAAKNIKEFIAECWAESLNNAGGRAAAKRVADILRRRYVAKFS